MENSNTDSNTKTSMPELTSAQRSALAKTSMLIDMYIDVAPASSVRQNAMRALRGFKTKNDDRVRALEEKNDRVKLATALAIADLDDDTKRACENDFLMSMTKLLDNAMKIGGAS